jgi:hypothetical protein
MIRRKSSIFLLEFLNERGAVRNYIWWCGVSLHNLWYAYAGSAVLLVYGIPVSFTQFSLFA